MVTANSDFTLSIVDLEKGVSQHFRDPTNMSFKERPHNDRIEGLVYSSLINRDTGQAAFPSAQKCVLSCSEDKTVKIWDRNQGTAVQSLRHRGHEFHSVDTNTNIIVAGTSGDSRNDIPEGDVVFWDVRNTKTPLEVLTEGHFDSVT